MAYLPPSTYSGPINNSINGTSQGDALIQANQQQAKALGVTIPGNPAPTASPPSTVLHNPDGSVSTQFGAGAAPAPVSIKDAYGSLSPNDQAIDTAVGVYRDASQAPVDEQAIRDATMKRLQAEIDATNRVFTEKLRQAHIAGEGRLGQNAAISARRGLLGSDFGASANDKVTNDNAGIYSGIGDEQAAAIAGITEKGAQMARQEIADKNAVKQQSATDYIAFLGKQEERRTSRTGDAAARALAAGIDLSSASSADVKAIADSYQISPDALVSSYVSAKNAAAKNAADLAATNATAAKPVGVSTTDNVYQIDPKTGQYTQTATGTPTDSTLKEYQYAVAKDGYTGSLQDWNAQKANQKVSNTVTHDPLTGALQVVQRAGPQVAGTGGTKLPAATTGSTALPSAKATTDPLTKPPTAPITNPLDTLKGSDLAYAQTGLPAQSKFKYPNQIDEAAKRIQAVIPGWTPANATASYNFFKSPTTQTFIGNSNTVLNSLDLIKTLSSKVSRGDFTFANGKLTGLKAGVSNEDAAKFLQAASIVGDEAGKLLGSSGGSDFTTQLGLSLVNTEYSDPTFSATMDQLAGRINNKVAEYYKQGGIATGNQPTTSTSTSTDITTLRAKYQY